MRLDCLVLATVLLVALGAINVLAYQGRSLLVHRLLFLTVVVGLLYVHGRILPLLDPNRDGRNFLGTVQHLVPEKATLFATGGPQVLRYSFYVKRPLISLWDPPAIARQTDGAGPFYVLAKASSREALEILGRPTQIASSLSSAGECPPKYCIALFRIDPS